MSGSKKALAVPDYLKGVSGPSADSMATGVGVSVPRVSLKGRKFRFIQGDEEIVHKGDSVDLIIIGVEPEQGLAKTYYKDGYTPSSSDPPDCSSWDGVRPDSWVSSPQSSNCASCPQAMWGSATSMTGKKAKACKESKRLIVVKADDPNGTYYILTVTIASLKALAEYGRQLVKLGNVPYSSVITTVSFVDSDFPQVEFTATSFLEEEEGLAMIARSQEREWDTVTQSTLPGPSNDAPRIADSGGGASEQAPPHTDAEAPPATSPATAADVKNLVDQW